jgi:hypothetical protein
MLKPLAGVVRTWSGEWRSPDDPLGAVEAVWEEVAGGDVALNAQPSRLRAGELLVVAASSAWSQQLALLAPQILAELGRRAPEANVDRLRFRTGRVVRPKRWEPPVPAPGGAPGRTCTGCGVRLAGPGEQCAACAGHAADERSARLERALYEMPWLHFVRLAAEIPGLSKQEYERTRLRLLDRWWQLLERAGKSGKLRSDGYERRIADSYVVLLSGLPVERISAAILKNLLGPEVHRLLYGAEASRGASKSKQQ